MREKDGRREGGPQAIIMNTCPKPASPPPAPMVGGNAAGRHGEQGAFRNAEPKAGPDDNPKRKSSDAWKVQLVMERGNAKSPCTDEQKAASSTMISAFMALSDVFKKELDALQKRDFGAGGESEADAEKERENWVRKASLFWYVHETSLRIFGALLSTDKQGAFMFFEDLHKHATMLLSEEVFWKSDDKVRDGYERLESMMRACVHLIANEAAGANAATPISDSDVLPYREISENPEISKRYEDKVWDRFTDDQIKRSSTPVPDGPPEAQEAEGREAEGQ